MTSQQPANPTIHIEKMLTNIEEVKQKLTDGEYKELVDTLGNVVGSLANLTSNLIRFKYLEISHPIVRFNEDEEGADHHYNYVSKQRIVKKPDDIDEWKVGQTISICSCEDNCAPSREFMGFLPLQSQGGKIQSLVPDLIYLGYEPL